METLFFFGSGASPFSWKRLVSLRLRELAGRNPGKSSPVPEGLIWC